MQQQYLSCYLGDATEFRTIQTGIFATCIIIIRQQFFHELILNKNDGLILNPGSQ